MPQRSTKTLYIDVSHDWAFRIPLKYAAHIFPHNKEAPTAYAAEVGDTFYDHPWGYDRAWGTARKKVRTVLQVIKANSPKGQGSRQLTIYIGRIIHPQKQGAATKGEYPKSKWEHVANYSMSNRQFVHILRTGDLPPKEQSDACKDLGVGVPA